jgi:hypothetical protein
VRDAFTIALVDDKGNACRRSNLARNVAPILTVRSGSDAAGPWLSLGGPIAANVNGAERPAQCRELLLDHEGLNPTAGEDAVWLVSTRAYTHVSLFGPASSNDRPEEMLSVSDAQGAFSQETVPLKLLAGPPLSLELEARSASTLTSHDLRTRQRFPLLVFVVVDAAGNPVPIEELTTVKPLTTTAPALLTVTHAPAMESEGNSGTRWSLRDIRLRANRDAHVPPARRLSHQLFFGAGPVAKAADGKTYSLQCAPIPVATRARDEFVVDFVCGSVIPEVVVAGTELHPFKISLRVEDGTVCNCGEIQLCNASSLRNRHALENGEAPAKFSLPHIDCIKCVLHSLDGKIPLRRVEGTALFRFPPAAAGPGLNLNPPMDASTDASGRLTRAGSYSVTATYTEHRPKVLDMLDGTQESVVSKTVLKLKLTAGPPARLRWARAPPDLACNNTSGRQIFGRTEARLEDAYGNPAVADGGLIGATLTAVLAPAAQPQPPVGSSAAAAPPQLEGAVSGTIDGKTSKVIIGPVMVEHGTGRGDSQLRVTFKLLATGGEMALPALVLPPDLAVRFEDTHSLVAEEARAKEAQAAEQGRLEARHAALQEEWQAKDEELNKCNAKLAGLIGEMRTWCSELVRQVNQVDSLVLFNLWSGDGAQPQRWDAAHLAKLIADMLRVGQQQAGSLCATLRHEFDRLRRSLADILKPNSTEEAFRSAQQYLLALSRRGESLCGITQVADGLGAWVGQLCDRYPEHKLDGLTD